MLGCRRMWGMRICRRARGASAGSDPAHPAAALLRALFQAYLIVALLVGVGLMLTSALLEEHKGSEILVDVLRDLGIGSVVSVFVVVLIEWRATLSLRREIATDVLEAVYRQVVPEVIYTEIRDSVFRSDVMRTDWGLTITVLPWEDCDGLAEDARERLTSEGVFLVELKTSYVVMNLGGRELPFLVKGWLDADVPIKDAGVPHFTSVDVGDEQWKSELTAALAKDLYRGAGSRVLAKDLKVFVETGKQMRFEKQVSLPRSGRLRVAYSAHCAFRAPGSHVISSQSPADGIWIEGHGSERVAFDVLPLHPQQEGLKSIGTPVHRWEFSRGILPWQGFQIVSSVVSETG